MKAAWIALAMMVAGASWADSPKSSGTANKCPTVEAKCSNQAQESQYPTKDAPLPVTVLQSVDDTKRTAERDRNTQEYRSRDLDAKIRLADDSKRQTRIAIATTLIAAVGTVIAAFALVFLRKTFRETKNAADAARDQVELSRQEFSSTHRPRIILREAYTARDNGHPITVFYALANTGGTEATIVGSKFAVFFSVRGGTKRQVKFGGELIAGEIENVVPAGHQIEAGGFYESSCSTPYTLWNDKWIPGWGKPDEKTVIAGPTMEGAHIYFYGKVSYRDASKIIRNMAFYRILEFDSYRFIPYGDSQLEYSDERA
jgi:hypothetical protein